MITKEDLKNFSEEVKNKFSKSEICGPIHLSGNNENKLIEIFKNIKSNDWIFSTHRSHYHALLHGINKEWLMQEICNGRSITIENISHKFVTSAIVSGILPIALGTALAIKKKNIDRHVWAFVGDMSGMSGIFHEVCQYATGHQLPLSLIVEDNGFSTNTPTQVVWGDQDNKPIDVYKYEYERIYPHQGCGKWVEF